MSDLKKAYLQALTPAGAAKPVGEPIPVQFNPSSLKLTVANTTKGGRTTGAQVKQYNATSSTTLALDLVFDSADEEGTGTDDARDVRERTKRVAQFILTGTDKKSKFAPPRVRFHWGTLQLDGVMTAFSEDIDLFSAQGVPLRAKVSITIQEQDAKLDLLQGGRGALDAAEARTPNGPPAGAPGSTASAPKDRSANALAGESAADFAARMGLDPEAWRGVAAGLDSALSLEAGAEIDFSSRLSLSAGVGLSGGIEGGSGVSLGESLGMTGGASPGATGRAAPGFALSAAGGVSAAVQAVQSTQAASAAAAARAAFRAPPTTATSASGGVAARRPVAEAGTTAGAGGLVRPAVGSVPATTAAAVSSAAASGVPTAGRHEQSRPRLQTTGLPSAGRAVAPPAPLPPTVDRRATSFGYGVPLRPQVHGAAQESASGSGWIRVAHRIPPRTAPETRDPTARPWEALPGLHEPRAAANAEQRRRAADRLCTCRGGSGAACGRHGGLR